jgi:hypothetical protein
MESFELGEDATHFIGLIANVGKKMVKQGQIALTEAD